VSPKLTSEITFETRDGLTLRADSMRPSSKSSASHPGTVLLFHGGGQSRLSWKSTASVLADAGYYCVSADLRGHGESDWSKTGDYSSDSFLSDVELIMDQLPKPIMLVGASLGGIVSLLVAGERRQEQVEALVLVDISPWTEDKGIARVLSFMNEHLNGFASLEEASEAVAKYMQHRAKPAMLDGLRSTLRRGEDGRYYWRWDPALMQSMNARRVIDSDRLLRAAKATSAKILLLRGVFSDVVTAESAERFLEHLPSAQYVEVDKAAHTIAGDSNQAFTSELVRFLNSLGKGSSS
jgi:pimeloyl-ACP methyl ester carboxylesterase